MIYGKGDRIALVDWKGYMRYLADYVVYPSETLTFISNDVGESFPEFYLTTSVPKKISKIRFLDVPCDISCQNCLNTDPTNKGCILCSLGYYRHEGREEKCLEGCGDGYYLGL